MYWASYTYRTMKMKLRHAHYTVLLFIESKNCTNSFCFLVHLIVVLSLRQLASIWINIKSINLKIRRKTEAYLEKIDFRFFLQLSFQIKFDFISNRELCSHQLKIRMETCFSQLGLAWFYQLWSDTWLALKIKTTLLPDMHTPHHHPYHILSCSFWSLEYSVAVRFYSEDFHLKSMHNCSNIDMVRSGMQDNKNNYKRG